MLVVDVRRIKDKKNGLRDYVYQINVNRRIIEVGRVTGHDPKTEWRGLLFDIALKGKKVIGLCLDDDKYVDEREQKEITLYKKPEWAINQIVRGDREDSCVDDICKHGIGHPNKQWAKNKSKFAVTHGCDGCCKEKK